MSSGAHPAASVRRPRRAPSARPHVRATWAALALCTVACADRDAVQVRLAARAVPDAEARRLEIRAQVAGPVVGLRYRWFSVAGENDPQESSEPETVFTFADGTTRDRVSVDVWRDDQRVAHHELDVGRDTPLARLAPPPRSKVNVAVTTIPRYEPSGGPDTRADIAGTVTGAISPRYRIAVYSRADVWYIQPFPKLVHEIEPDGRWATWTHTGSSYAVLVVTDEFDPVPRIDVLPQVGGTVVARTIVEGTRP